MSFTARNNNLKVLAALVSVYILWGSTYLAIKISLESFPPFFLAGFRFFFTGSVLYLLLRLKGSPAPTRAQWGGGATLGALLLLIGNGGVVMAEQWVASSLAALGVATVPLWTVVFGMIWKRRPGAVEAAGVVLGFLGVVLLNFEGHLRANPIGAAALMVAAVSWAFGSAWSKNIPLPSGLMAAAVEMITGGLFLFIASFIAGESLTGMPGQRATLALFYLMFFGAFVGFSAYTWLINNVRPALATSYAYVNPAIAVVLGATLAGESITREGVAAMAVIIIAVILVILGKGRVEDDEAERA